MRDRIVACDTLTGKQLAHVPVSDYRWTSSMTSPGRGSFTVELEALDHPISEEMIDRLMLGWGTTIVVDTAPTVFHRTGVIRYAGLIESVDLDHDAGTLEITTAEVEAMLERRMLLGVSTFTKEPLRVTGASVKDLIRELIRIALSTDNTLFQRWGLPVMLPEKNPGSLTRTYFWYNFQTAATQIEELSEEEGAPDWLLMPEWRDGLLCWRLKFGDPEMHLNDVRLPVTSSEIPIESQVSRLRKRIDYRHQRTGQFVLGAGSEADMRFGREGVSGELITQNVPYMDFVTSHKTVDNQGMLDSIARQELWRDAYGTQQLSFVVTFGPNELVHPSEVRKGTVIHLDSHGAPGWEPGLSEQLVIEVSGSKDDSISVETQEVKLNAAA